MIVKDNAFTFYLKAYFISLLYHSVYFRFCPPVKILLLKMASLIPAAVSQKISNQRTFVVSNGQQLHEHNEHAGSQHLNTATAKVKNHEIHCRRASYNTVDTSSAASYLRDASDAIHSSEFAPLVSVKCWPNLPSSHRPTQSSQSSTVGHPRSHAPSNSVDMKRRCHTNSMSSSSASGGGVSSSRRGSRFAFPSSDDGDGTAAAPTAGIAASRDGGSSVAAPRNIAMHDVVDGNGNISGGGYIEEGLPGVRDDDASGSDHHTGPLSCIGGRHGRVQRRPSRRSITTAA